MKKLLFIFILSLFTYCYGKEFKVSTEERRFITHNNVYTSIYTDTIFIRIDTRYVTITSKNHEDRYTITNIDYVNDCELLQVQDIRISCRDKYRVRCYMTLVGDSISNNYVLDIEYKNLCQIRYY